MKNENAIVRIKEIHTHDDKSLNYYKISLIKFSDYCSKRMYIMPYYSFDLYPYKWYEIKRFWEIRNFKKEQIEKGKSIDEKTKELELKIKGLEFKKKRREYLFGVFGFFSGILGTLATLAGKFPEETRLIVSKLFH